MKLNFWQIIGVALLVLGLAWLGWNKLGSRSNVNPTSPTTQTGG